MLDRIEAQMFQRPENLDSLLAKIDTTNISPFEQARINSIRGLSHFERGEIDMSIKEAEKAETVFISKGDQFHSHINQLIRAFTFEYLNLNYQAAELYVDCENYFGRNHLDAYKFYATLGLLRLSEQLNLNKKVLIDHLQKAAKDFNDPNYYGLLYATLGVLEKNDSIKNAEYEKAKFYFRSLSRWSRIYAIDLNNLFARITQDHSEQTQLYYDNFNKRNYLYTPTLRQNLRYRYGQAYLYAKQGKNIESIEVANQILVASKALNIFSVETECVKLLAVLYKLTNDYKNANRMLERYQSLQEKDLKALQQSRLLALGAHYRYSELERVKLELKMKNQKYLLMIGVICMLFTIVFSFFWYSYKRSKYIQEILKLKNMEIKDQIDHLILSLGNQKDENVELIRYAEELKIKVHQSDSLRISDFLQAIDQNEISNWVEFDACFKRAKPGWIEKLKHRIPEFTATDLKYCQCLYLNLNNYRIAKICDTGVEGVKAAKKRIRDKLALNDSKEIYFFLQSIE
jgi:DNA-binding CsgD family transcriptional regulator